MFASLVRPAFGLVAAVALLAAPSAVKAQYVAQSPSVGVSVGTPGFGLNLGFGQPVYQPAPVIVPTYPTYPVYSPGYPVYAPRPVAPYWGPRYGGYRPYAPAYGHYGHYPYRR